MSAVRKRSWRLGAYGHSFMPVFLPSLLPLVRLEIFMNGFAEIDLNASSLDFASHVSVYANDCKVMGMYTKWCEMYLNVPSLSAL